MMTKRINNLLKLSILIGIRQGYKLSRNCYELFYEPEITIRELVDDFDKSQMLLLVLTALSPLFIYLILRIIVDLIKFGNIAAIYGNGLNIVLFIESLIFIYLGYFVLKVLFKK